MGIGLTMMLNSFVPNHGTRSWSSMYGEHMNTWALCSRVRRWALRPLRFCLSVNLNVTFVTVFHLDISQTLQNKWWLGGRLRPWSRVLCSCWYVGGGGSHVGVGTLPNLQARVMGDRSPRRPSPLLLEIHCGTDHQCLELWILTSWMINTFI